MMAFMVDSSEGTRREPVSTYRIQLAGPDAFEKLGKMGPYLAELGISHAYLSPILQAAPGSQHGYDVVDHGLVSLDLGGESAFRQAVEKLHESGLEVVLDIVPNHMALPTPEYLNAALWSLLREGPQSPYASWFDLADEEQIMMPILGQRIDMCIDAGQLVVDLKGGPDGSPVLRYFDHVMPIRAGTEDLPLEELLALQFYRLAYWQVASEELNYRRFFDVDTLVALRVERKEVFDDSHAVILRLMREGLVQGLRVDHPDGLADPIGYLRRLEQAAPAGSWVVIEKILALDEHLDEGLVCDGTTGYEAQQRIGGLFVDPAGKAVLTTAFAEIAEVSDSWAEAGDQAKRDVLDLILVAEVDRLARIAHAICQSDVRLRDHSLRGLAEAITEVLVAFGVYRAYVIPGEPATEPNVERADDAIRTALERIPHRESELGVLRDLILCRLGPDHLRDEFCVRFQQTCGAVMAKGIEDTANYRWFPLSALCEVGGEADHFGVLPEEFHEWARQRQARWPRSMNALSTHDAKRSEDVRARLAALSEIPGEWVTTVHALVGLTGGLQLPDGGTDGATEWLLWQSIVGAWPINAERVSAYMIKAVREAKLHTSWNEPDERYEEALTGYINEVLANEELVSAVVQVVERLHPALVTNSLGQRAVQLLTPGVPDIYGGCEVVCLRLVDPDNRYPLDQQWLNVTLSRALDDVPDPGNDLDAAKARLTGLGLGLRRSYPDAVGDGGAYSELAAEGPAAEHAVGICRGNRLATVVTRLPMRLIAKGGWDGTRIHMPAGLWRNVLTEVDYPVTSHHTWLRVSDLLGDWPVALLERIAD